MRLQQRNVATALGDPPCGSGPGLASCWWPDAHSSCQQRGLSTQRRASRSCFARTFQTLRDFCPCPLLYLLEGVLPGILSLLSQCRTCSWICS